MNQDNGYPAAVQILLIGNSLIQGEKDMVAGALGERKKFTVALAGQTGFRNSDTFVTQ